MEYFIYIAGCLTGTIIAGAALKLRATEAERLTKKLNTYYSYQNDEILALARAEKAKKAGKTLISEMLDRLKSSGNDIHFANLYQLLREQYDIESAADFADLSTFQRTSIEAALSLKLTPMLSYS